MIFENLRDYGCEELAFFYDAIYMESKHNTVEEIRKKIEQTEQSIGKPEETRHFQKINYHREGCRFIFPFARFKTFAFQANSFSMFLILNI
jgi:hypothetical protein